MSSDRFIIGGILLLTVLVLGGILFSFNRQTAGEAAIAAYTADDPARPVVELPESTTDLGAVSMSEIKTTEFTVKNSGQSPLMLFEVKTSCDCTRAVVSVGDVSSPTLSMHNNPNWVSKVPPGGEARVKVEYEPAVHPVKGPVSRFVQINTNDPSQPQLQLTITANVQ